MSRSQVQELAISPITARSRLAEPAVVLFACMFLSQAGLLVLSPTLPEIAREFGISAAVAGQLRTLSGLVGGLTAVALALAPSRPGLRALLSAGAALVGLGSLISAAAPSFAVLAGGQAVLGAGIGMLVAIAIAIAAAGTWSTPADRPRTLAWAIAGMPVAWVVGMPLTGIADAADWRLAWVAVPFAASLVALALLRLRPADAPTRRAPRSGGGADRGHVARFAAGELLANAAWASVLTYSGVLLIEGGGASHATVALGLAIVAAAMVPGAHSGRRHAVAPTVGLLAGLTFTQAAAVVALGAIRPTVAFTLGVMTVMAFVNGWRSIVASSHGMDTSPDDAVAMMSVRAAANQFGYLLGAAAGGLAIGAGGFPAFGVVLAGLFVIGGLVHLAPVIVVRVRLPVAQEAHSR